MYKRQAIIAIVNALLIVSLFACSKNKATEDESEDNPAVGFPRIMTLFAAEDIAEGSKLTPDKLKQHVVNLQRLPQDAVTGSSPRVIGRTTKYRIMSGQIIRYHDLAPEYGAEDYMIRLFPSERDKLTQLAKDAHKNPSQLLTDWVEEHLSKQK